VSFALAACGTTDKLTENCAETLLEGELCGDELVEFCTERYDRQINADTCDPVLRDAGIDPEEMLAERRRRRAERKLARIEAARVPVRIGEAGRVGGLEYVVENVTEASSLDGAYGTVLEPKGGNKLVVANLIYRNVGTKPADLLCGGASGFALIDELDRQFSVDDEAMFESILNDEACSEELQPGSEEDAQVIFDIGADVEPRVLRIWNGNDYEGPEGGARHLEYELPSALPAE
jgi:hypothetical protein